MGVSNPGTVNRFVEQPGRHHVIDGTGVGVGRNISSLSVYWAFEVKYSGKVNRCVEVTQQRLLCFKHRAMITGTYDVEISPPPEEMD